MWDVATERATPLRRVGGGGNCLLRWSPDGSKLFSGCPSAIFRYQDQGYQNIGSLESGLSSVMAWVTLCFKCLKLSF